MDRAAGPEPTEQDAVDRILGEWALARPDLDASPMGVIGRVGRLAGLLDAGLRPVFAERGLGDGEFDVLATLRRAGGECERTPGELAARTMVTSGAVSKRIDRLEARGLVRRAADDADGRVRRVRLTAEGRRLVDEAVEAHLANERRLLAALSPEDQRELAALLRRLCLALGDQPGHADGASTEGPSADSPAVG